MEKYEALEKALTELRSDGVEVCRAADVAERTDGFLSANLAARMLKSLGYSATGDHNRRKWYIRKLVDVAAEVLRRPRRLILSALGRYLDLAERTKRSKRRIDGV